MHSHVWYPWSIEPWWLWDNIQILVYKPLFLPSVVKIHFLELTPQEQNDHVNKKRCTLRWEASTPSKWECPAPAPTVSMQNRSQFVFDWLRWEARVEYDLETWETILWWGDPLQSRTTSHTFWGRDSLIETIVKGLPDTSVVSRARTKSKSEEQEPRRIQVKTWTAPTCLIVGMVRL
jgi:hypothetical protein